MEKIQQNLKQWENKNLSILGKIRAIKMCIIPKMFYLFQTLPEEISKKQLTAWDGEIKNWIFGKKRARTIRKVIYTSQDELGWGVPNLESYYQAFQLRMLLEMEGSGIEKWVRWEDVINKGAGKFGIFTSNTKNEIKNTIGPRHIVLKIWDKYKSKWLPNISKWAPLESVYEKLIESDKNFWIKLKEKGYFIVKDMYTVQGTLYPIQEWLREVGGKYWLQATSLYNVLKQRKCHLTVNKEETEWKKIYRNKKENNKGTTKKIYLLMCKVNVALIIQKQWEKEVKLSKQEVDRLIIGIRKIKIEKFRELEMKLILKWYRTPLQLSYMFKGNSPNCWHCGNEKGYYIHIWWECPKVKDFWHQILKKVEVLCKIKLENSRQVIFAGILEDNKVEDKELLKAIIIAAHAVIAREWKDITKWNMDLWNSYLYNWIQSDIIEILGQEKTWEEKQIEIRKKWNRYIKWVKKEEANKIIYVKVQRLCTWLKV